MTAKEKAEELIEQVKKATTFNYQEYAGAHQSTFEHDIEELKNVALIMADETWKVLWKLYDNPNTSDSAELIIKEQIDFWADVKDELS
jgi:hypothetical protein